MAGIGLINYLVYNGINRGKVISIKKVNEEYREIGVTWDKKTDYNYFYKDFIYHDIILHPSIRRGDYVKPIKIDNYCGIIIPRRFRYMNCYLLKTYKEQKLNDLITVKLVGNHKFKDIIIYVKEKYFSQCKKTLLNIPLKSVKDFKYIDDIDQIIDLYDKKYELINEYDIEICPEEEFFAHCSNIQTWIENDYNTKILHSNLSFPLLRKLVKYNDNKAKKVFKDEIINRIESEYIPTFKYLVNEGYLECFTQEELNIISENIKDEKIKEFLEINYEKYFKSYFIKDLGDNLVHNYIDIFFDEK
ncbi:MAG: hypothetical protein ACFFG0_07570 [Candidatus Thorarchaeota archaeon]